MPKSESTIALEARRERRLKELDASIEESLTEMAAAGGRDLHEVCDEIIADIRKTPESEQL